MEKYKAMFWSLLNGLLAGVIFLVGIGFLATASGDAAAVAAAVVAAAAVAVVAAAVVAAAGSIPAGMFFLVATMVAGIGCLAICRKFKQEDATVITTLATVAGVILIGFISAAKIAYVQLIPKDQEIIQSLERKDLVFTLPMNQEKYLKEFFFLGQKDGNLISFRDAKFELEKIIHRCALPDSSVKNETREMMTVSFDGIDLTTIEGLIIQHPLVPQTKIPLETIGKQ